MTASLKASVRSLHAFNTPPLPFYPLTRVLSLFTSAVLDSKYPLTEELTKSSTSSFNDLHITSLVIHLGSSCVLLVLKTKFDRSTRSYTVSPHGFLFSSYPRASTSEQDNHSLAPSMMHNAAYSLREIPVSGVQIFITIFTLLVSDI